MTFSLGIRQYWRSLAFVTVVAAGALSAPALAQEADEAFVVATVNGEPITTTDLGIAAAEFGDQLTQVPADRRAQALLDLYINIRLAAGAAEADELDQDAIVAKRLQLVRERTLYSEFLRRAFTENVSEEAIRKAFDAELAAFEPADEVRARHILVETEDEAKAIIAELDDGGDFEAIAKEKSIDSGSGARGGDLGFFARGTMVPPFEDAAFGLEVGAYTDTPVKSDFGYHIIKVEQARQQPAPTFEVEAQRIQQQLVRDTFESEIGDLRSQADIVIEKPIDAPSE